MRLMAPHSFQRRKAGLALLWRCCMVAPKRAPANHFDAKGIGDTDFASPHRLPGLQYLRKRSRKNSKIRTVCRMLEFLFLATRGESTVDNGRNHNPPQNSTIMITTMAITIASTTITLINTKASIILESLFLGA